MSVESLLILLYVSMNVKMYGRIVGMTQNSTPHCCPSSPPIADGDRCQQAAHMLAALSDVTRLRLAVFIYRCSPNPVCACSFPEVFGISRSTVSHHLTRLVDVGILRREQQGKWAYYSIDPDFDVRLLDVISEHMPQACTPRMATKKSTILFACRQNAGRSQMAAAIAEHLAAADVTVMSAGTQPADEVQPEVREVLSEIGLVPLSAPEKLDPAKIREADWVITMGCGESCPIFPGTHYEDWDVDDPSGQPLDVVRKIRDGIDVRVRELLGRIG